jgi:hypothetical protein
LTPAIVPPAIPPVEPVPPGSGGFAQSPSAAKRREEVRKHARQSAFVVRPAGTRGADWFYAGIAAATLLTLLLCARAMPPASGTRPALLLEPSADEGRSRRRRRRLPR